MKRLLPIALLAVLLLCSAPARADTFDVIYAIQGHSQLFGSSDPATGDTVMLSGFSGTLPMPFGVDSGATELIVGQLSITTHLTRQMPHGFIFYPFPLTVTINGESKVLTQQLMMVVDNSNDAAVLLGGIGTTAWDLNNGMTVDFQFLTSATGAANDGETKTSNVIGEFYGHKTVVPEPGLPWLLAISLAVLALFGVRRH